MKKLHVVGVTWLAALVPLAAAAQPASVGGQGVSWQPAVYAGVWTRGSGERRPGEAVVGPMAAFELRRRDPRQRVSFVATVSGYSKGGGEFTFDVPARDYEVREDLLTLGIGGDFDLTQGPTDWTVGVSIAAATSRSTSREISSTGLPFGVGADPGWNRVTALFAVRSGATLPVAQKWGLRLGVEVLHGAESLSEAQPMFGAHVGLVWRR